MVTDMSHHVILAVTGCSLPYPYGPVSLRQHSPPWLFLSHVITALPLSHPHFFCKPKRLQRPWGMMKRAASLWSSSTTYILTFLSWPHDLHLLLSTPSHNASFIAISATSPPLARWGLLLSRANTPAMRCELVKSLLLDFVESRVLFAHSQGARAATVMPRLRSFSVEVSVDENRYRTAVWIFPRDAPFRPRSIATAIR